MNLERETLAPENLQMIELKEEVVNGGYPEALWHKTENFALQFLQEGRPDWDVPHTQAVVHWAHRLVTDYNERVEAGAINGKKVDERVVITAAWLHDIGYSGEFDEVADLQQVTEKKPDHMANGAKMARHFLEEEGQELLDKEQIEQVTALVGAHDDLEKINELGMAGTVLMEADTLGAMDTEWVEPSYKGREALTFPIREKSLARRKMFKTPLGRESLDDVVKNFWGFVIDRDFQVAKSRE